MSTIRFEGVSKLFHRRHAHSPDGELWAVRDVDFECREGEVVGLVGRNGCGKSTILKLAAGVTSPTKGSIACVKPLAPMLELGTGFHPDLTGRDNIALNGCFLGLGRPIGQKVFDEIVAFAGLEEHVDTPVKHYSSGMYARLGFAVAVHSPAKVLLVDEVLSVGDQLFRQKCLNRMKHLREQGTTIMLVSHDRWWIRYFCDRVLVVDGGRLLADSRPEDALSKYDKVLSGLSDGSPSGITIGEVAVIGMSGSPADYLPDTSARVRVVYDARAGAAGWIPVARVRREDGVCCATCVGQARRANDVGSIFIEMTDLFLAPGRYQVEVSIEDSCLTALATLASKPFYVHGPFDDLRGYDGVIPVRHEWSFE